MTIKVFIINTAGMGLGGITTHMLTYLEAVLSDYPNLSVTIGVTGIRDDDVIRRFRKLGCEIVYLPDRKKHVLSYVMAINKVMNIHHFKVLHVHGNSGTMFIELLCGMLHRIPIRIAHCHNSQSDHMSLHKFLGPLFRKSYTNALACSDMAGEWLFGKNGYVVLPNAVNLTQFRYSKNLREKKRRELGLSSSIPVVGHVGNFNQQKNHVYLIDIFKEILKEEDAVLLLLGAGPLEGAIRERISEDGLSDKVIFLGLQDDVYEWMQAMDCFIFPSKWEGFGTVLIEAQASGLPILASNVIPAAVKINSNFVFLDLKQSPSQWASVANRLLKSGESERCIDTKKFKEYDISYTKNIVEKIYQLQEM